LQVNQYFAPTSTGIEHNRNHQTALPLKEDYL